MECLNILHFNDVYNVEEMSSEPFGGAARFTTALKAHGAEKEGIVLFSGDCLNPSLLSVTTRGKHMPPIMNEMNVKCSLFGNHEFDFGIDRLEKRIKECNFPWINSNMYDLETETYVLNTLPYVKIKHQNLQIGIIGLIEREWVDTIPCFLSSRVQILDFCEIGQKLAVELKSGNDPCNLVIALTHMRWPNDRLLATQVPEIDFILGGHDHEYNYEWIQCKSNENSNLSSKRLILKSGSDFRTFTHLHIMFDKQLNKICDIKLEKVLITSEWEPDVKVRKLI